MLIKKKKFSLQSVRALLAAAGVELCGDQLSCGDGTLVDHAGVQNQALL